MATQRQPLPIGIDDYKELIEKGYYHVDKTLFIKELLENSPKALLIPRPRRFSKTLNMSMLKYFFSNDENDYSHLFENKKIWKCPECRKHFGQYPVVFITFKGVKEDNWEDARRALVKIIAKEFFKFRFLLESSAIEKIQKAEFLRLMEEKATSSDMNESLEFLTKLLTQHYGKPAIVLIDEYDTPINYAHMNDYYKKMVGFMKNILHAVLKGNEHLEFGVMTGVMRVAKEGIFSGLNNLEVCNMKTDKYSDQFGFTHDEVSQMLQNYGLEKHEKEVKNWYNGYRVGWKDKISKVYNPWSIINFLNTNGSFQPYWVNTGNPEILKKIMLDSSEDTKKSMDILLSGMSFAEEIDDGLIFPEIEKNYHAVWNMLFYSGYITFDGTVGEAGYEKLLLKVPNNEVMKLFHKMASEIFKQKSFSTDSLKDFIKALLVGDDEELQEILQDFVMASMGVYDFDSDEPEKSYHLFVLGMLVFMRDEYIVRSNHLSGKGRYDIMIIPKNIKQIETEKCFIIEFKKAKPGKMEKAAQKGLDQIEEKNYEAELLDQGFTKDNIVKYGIAFQGKDVFVKRAP